MNILVTGASGYLGQFLLESILSHFVTVKECPNTRIGYTYCTDNNPPFSNDILESFQVH